MKHVLLLLLLSAGLAGCTSSDQDAPGTETPGPSTGLPESISDFEHLGVVEAGSAAGIWVEDGYAYLSGGPGLRIVDVADPTAPVVVVSEVAETQSSRDVDLLHHSNGRTYAILAHGGSRVTLTDVTNPAQPSYVGEVTNINAAHNIAVVPGSDLVYVSHSILIGVPTPGQSGKIDIIDLSDPAAPTVTPFEFPAVASTVDGAVKPVGATTCHDITFNQDLARAYCAGVTETHIWDIADPQSPTILQVIASPANQIHHGVWDARNGTLLIIGDEFAGALTGPVCSPVPNPYAALWFIDISDLATPVPQGYFQVEYDSAGNNNLALCTTHFGTLVEDRDLFVIGWYTAGTVLVDFQDPMDPTQVAHFRPDGNVNTWEARYFDGHIYTGDGARGMDVLRLV